jgi:vitamin B12 transporter
MKIFVSRARMSALPLALAAAGVASAQTPSQLQSVVVTATRVAQPLSELLADVTVVDRTQIEASGAAGLADVLARLPGVEFQRTGGPGSTTGVFLRGGESRFTAVYIDGVRIDAQSTGGAAWESVPLAQVERIEVLRGPAAAVYGSDALTGVVQIFTKRGEAGFAPFVSLGVGSQGTRKLAAGLSGAQGAFDYALGFADDKSTGFDARPTSTPKAERDGYRSQSVSARLGYKINSAHSVDATWMVNDLDSQYDSGLDQDDHGRRKLQTLGLNWQARLTDIWQARLSLSDSLDRYQSAPLVYSTETRLRGYLLHNEVRLGRHLITADLDRKEDHLENAPISRGRSQDGAALGYGFRDGAHTLQLNARHDRDSEFGGKGTGSAAYGYALSPQWRATASAGTAFRAPTLYQRFSEYGVATLRPESSRNIELGLRFSQGTSQFGVVAYRNNVDNLITFGAAGPCASPFGCYANTAKAVYEGVTFTAAQQLGGLQLKASLDLQDPRDAMTGKQLARRASRHGTLTADTALGGWTVGAEAQLSGPRFDDARNTRVLAGYTLFNLSASTPLRKDWTLVARVDNLADQKYELASGYGTPGRTLYVGAKWAP